MWRQAPALKSRRCELGSCGVRLTSNGFLDVSQLVETGSCAEHAEKVCRVVGNGVRGVDGLLVQQLVHKGLGEAGRIGRTCLNDLDRESNQGMGQQRGAECMQEQHD